MSFPDARRVCSGVALSLLALYRHSSADCLLRFQWPYALHFRAVASAASLAFTILGISWPLRLHLPARVPVLYLLSRHVVGDRPSVACPFSYASEYGWLLARTVHGKWGACGLHAAALVSTNVVELERMIVA